MSCYIEGAVVFHSQEGGQKNTFEVIICYEDKKKESIVLESIQ